MSYRIGLYVLGTLMISVVSDYKSTPASRVYLSDTNNVFNQWFVKIGWFWTLLVVGNFTFLTARTYSCGKISIIRNNMIRLVIATAVWFGITQLFQSIENRTGVCETMKYSRKESCTANGFLWKGIDISGHCFLLVFSNLFIIEEGKAYLGWERIKDYMRMEEHKRISDTKDVTDTPLTKLKNEEFLWLRKYFSTSTPYVRILFCLLAFVSLLWDLMLLSTLLYFHLMIEKVVASGVAVLLWFSLYKCLYKHELSPGLPGDGPFKYVTWTDPTPNVKTSRKNAQKTQEKANKWSSLDEVPKFMGMPLYALRDYKEEAVPDDPYATPDTATATPASLSKRGSLAGGRQGSISDLSLVRPLGRARSRSVSRSRAGSTSKSSLNIRW